MDSFNGAEICYTLQGDEKNPLAVMVHGAEMGQWIYEKYAQWVVSRGFRVLTFDWFGHGESDLPAGKHTAEFYVKYIHELLTVLKLADIKKTWFGAGGGGAVSVEYCAAHLDTIERLVLMAPAGFVTDPAIGLFNCCPCIGDCYIGFCTCIVRKMFNTIVYDKVKHPEAAKLLREKVDWSIANNPGFQTSVFCFVKDFPVGGVEKEAKAIGAKKDLPVLLIWGDKDYEGGWGTPIAHAEKFKACIPHVTYHVMKDVHHAFWLEKPEETYKLVGDWLDATKAGAGVEKKEEGKS